MRHVATMTLAEIQDEISAIESQPMRSRTLYEATRIRELRSAERSIRRSDRWWLR